MQRKKCSSSGRTYYSGVHSKRLQWHTPTESDKPIMQMPGEPQNIETSPASQHVETSLAPDKLACSVFSCFSLEVSSDYSACHRISLT